MSMRTSIKNYIQWKVQPNGGQEPRMGDEERKEGPTIGKREENWFTAVVMRARCLHKDE